MLQQPRNADERATCNARCATIEPAGAQTSAWERALGLVPSAAQAACPAAGRSVCHGGITGCPPRLGCFSLAGLGWRSGPRLASVGLLLQQLLLLGLCGQAHVPHQAHGLWMDGREERSERWPRGGQPAEAAVMQQSSHGQVPRNCLLVRASRTNAAPRGVSPPAASIPAGRPACLTCMAWMTHQQMSTCTRQGGGQQQTGNQHGRPLFCATLATSWNAAVQAA